MSTGPLFSEIIGIEFDTASFSSSLGQMKSAYQSFLSDLSGSGISGQDVLGAGLVADFSKSIQQVKTEVSDLAKSFKDAFAQVGAASSAASGKLADAGEEKSGGTKSQIQKLEDLSLALQKGEGDWAEFASAAQKALEGGLNPALAKSIALQEQLRTVMKDMSSEEMAFTNKQADFLARESRRPPLAEEIVKGGAPGNYLVDLQKQLEEQNNKIAESKKLRDSFYTPTNVGDKQALQEEEALRKSELESFRTMMETKADLTTKLKDAQASLEEQQHRASESMLKVQDAVVAQSSAVEKGHSDPVVARFNDQVQAAKAAYEARTSLAQQYAEAVKLIESQIGDIETRTADNGKAVYQEEIESNIKNLQRLANEADRVYSQAGQAARRSASLSGSPSSAGPEAEEHLGMVGQFVAGMKDAKDNVGSMAASLVLFQVEWPLIQAAITAALSPLIAFRDTLKAGFAYMTELQQEAAALQGVIASSVEFSKDPFENFVTSGKAAEAVVKKLQDASVATGMSYSTLSRSFKAFDTGGGQHLVKNLGEAVQLSNMFAMAMVAAGKDVQTTRMLMSDVPKLLDGSVTASSSLLRVLGLTQAQWLKMRSSAQTNHDLLQQLSPLMANYVKVAEEAGDRTGNLEKALKLSYERASALVSGPAWNWYLSVLKQGVELFHSQSTEVNATASGVGELIAAVGNLVVAMATLGQGAPSIKAGFGGILDVVSVLTEAILGMANATTLMVKNLGHAVKMIAAFGTIQGMAHPGEALDEYLKSTKADWAAYQQKQNESANRLSDVLTGTHLSAANQPTSEDSLLGKNAPAKGNPPDHTPHKAAGHAESPLQVLHQQFTNSLQNIHDTSNHYRQDIKNKQQTNQIDSATALHATSVSYQNERTQVLDLVKVTAAKAQALVPQASSHDKEVLNKHVAAIMGDSFSSDVVGKTITESVTKSVVGAASSDTIQPTAASRQAAGKVTAQAVDVFIQGLGRASGVGKLTNSLAQAHTNEVINQNKQTYQSIHDHQKVAHNLLVNKIKTDRVEAGSGNKPLSSVLKEELVSIVQQHKMDTTTFRNQLSMAGNNTSLVEKINTDEKINQQDYEQQYRAKHRQITDQLFSEGLQPLHTKLEQDMAAQGLAKQHAEFLSKGKGHSTLVTNQANFQVAQQNLVVASDKRDIAQKVADYQSAVNPGSHTDQIAQQALIAAQGKVAQAQAAVSQPFGSDKSVKASLWDVLSGGSGSPSNTTGSKPADILNGMNNAVKGVAGAVGEIKQGINKGGVLGGVGAGLTSIAPLVSAINPVAGAIVTFAGTILSTIGDMFTAYAAHIANEIKLQYKITMENYQDHTATAALTLQQVEAEKQSAITKLTGAKGGQDQLSKLLPTLDATIAQLKQNMAQTLDQFTISMTQMTSSLATGGLTGPLGTMVSSWDTINKSVQAYIAAGGSAATAYQYLSQSLTQIKDQAGNALVQGEQTAVTQAINLNNLLQQRIDLERQQSSSTFSLLTSDSLQREGSSAISTGIALQTQQQQYNLQMLTLNAQISGAQQQVSLYKQIYDISGNTAQMLAESNSLQSQQLSEQIAQLQQYGQIYQNIFTNQSGNSFLSGPMASFLNNFTYNFGTGQINEDNWLGNIANVTNAAATSVTSAIQQNAQYGTNASYQQQY